MQNKVKQLPFEGADYLVPTIWNIRAVFSSQQELSTGSPGESARR